MNSIKNTIVTVTLLAVSYGAYVVLSESPNEMGMANGDNWNRDGGPDSESAPLVQLPDEVAHVSTQEANMVDMSSATDASTAAAAVGTLPEAYSTNEAAQPPVGVATGPDALPSHAAPAGQVYTSSDPAALPANYNDPSEAAGQAGAADAFEETWKSIQSSIGAGRLADALFALTVWYGEPTLTQEQASRCVRLLDELAGTVIYSQDSFMEPAYVVQEGETLEEIARTYHVPADFLARINGVESPYQLYPGETLKVVRGPFRAELSPQASEITVFLGRYYAGRFRVRLGDELPAGAGEFEVAVKEPGREYFDRRTGYRIGRDDPSNPYGARWIGLRGQQITAAHNVGIHVDNGAPEGGCIAVSSQDAEDLNAILSVGSRVVVKR